MNYTPKQLRILKEIHSFTNKHGYAPTLMELAKTIGVSTITIFEHMEALERKGAITRRTHAARSAEIVDKDFLQKEDKDNLLAQALAILEQDINPSNVELICKIRVHLGKLTETPLIGLPAPSLPAPITIPSSQIPQSAPQDCLP